MCSSRYFDVKEEVLRLASSKTGREMMQRRWEYVIKLRDEGLMSWEEIGHEIQRSSSTAKAVYERAWINRQRARAVCGCCAGPLTKVKTSFRQKREKSGRRVAFIYQGYCLKCNYPVWSKPMKPFSYEYATDAPVDAGRTHLNSQ